MKKLQLKDLLSALSQPQQQQQQKAQATLTTQQFLTGPSQQVQQLPLREQLRIKRESTYRNTQQEMDKWIGIIKLNRQKETLNFAVKEKDNAASVSFFPATPISNFHSKMEVQLKQLELQSQKTIMNKQEEALAKMSKEEAKQRLQQARKQRTLQFNEEIKRRRIAKIKSKIYHKIKKRQKQREQSKRIAELQGEQKNQYVQKLTKQRIHERITLRHKSKNKHIQNLLRFSKGNKQSIQQSINQVNAIRHQQLEKANEGFKDNMSEELDEQNYREQIEDIQKQIDQIENEDQGKQKGLDGMKFMKIGRQKEINQDKKQANKLLKLLDDPSAIQVQEDTPQQEPDGQITKKTYGEIHKQQKQAQNIKQNYIQKNLRNALADDQKLIEGINVNRLKQKYQPQRAQLDLTEAIKLHRQTFNAPNEVIQQNYRDFQAQKFQNYEAELPEQKKKLKGWGSWAGPGISQPKVDHAAQVKKKLAKIQQIKRKRRDGQMAGAIVRQSYNKQLKDYFVNKLPHNIKSAEQFDYLQNERIGIQWNTQTQFSKNILPKVMTKAGHVIQAIRMPKYIEKTKK